MKNLWINKRQDTLFWITIRDRLPKGIDLVEMRDEIPWEELVELVSTCYSSVKWARSKPIRMMIALEIVKSKYGYSDKELVEQLNTNLAVMYFCWFEDIVDIKMDSSTMTKFRNRLTEEVLMKLQDIAIKPIVRKLPKRRINTVMSDTTCFEENIAYPTDTGLLKKVINKTTEILETSRKYGNKIIIRGKRKFKKMTRGFDLNRRKSKKDVKKMIKKQIRRWEKLIKEAKEFIENKKEEIEEKIYKKWNDFIEVAEKVVGQQKDMIIKNTRKIKDRIVSIHKPEIRPIFRGKIKSPTEFWTKINVNLIGWKYMTITKITKDNISDTEQIETSINKHKDITWKYPNEYWYDRWWHSPWNHKLLEKKGITDWIQYRWRIPKKAKLPLVNTKKRLYKQRVVVEAKIWIAKRKYGLNKNIFSVDNAINKGIFGIIAMNYTCSVNR